MKNVSFIFIFFVSTSLQAQNNNEEKIIGKIIYDFRHIRDTITQYTHREEMMLMFSRNISSYSSQTKYLQDSIRNKAYANAEFNGGAVNLGVIKPTTLENIFVVPFEKKIITIVSFQRNQYLITDTGEMIKWTITQESKKIKGFVCQKALCNYKGRAYEAWFTLDLPFGFGPWKLHGLPGLILEATDSKKEVQFTLQSVEKSPGSSIVIPVSGIRTTKNDFNKMMTAYMEGGARGRMNNGDGDIKIDGATLSGSNSNRNGQGKPMNNPIEKNN